jgi:hypothetical protein
MAQGPGTPKPECCGEPMLWQTDTRKNANGGYWLCRPDRKAVKRKQYADLNGRQYNRLLLRNRRTKALKRRRNREAA